MKYISRIAYFVLSMLIMGCMGQDTESAEGEEPVEALSRAIASTPAWELEWYHFADLECLVKAGSRPEMVESLLELDDTTLVTTLSDARVLANYARPFVAEMVEQNRDRLPAGAAVPWRDAWPAEMAFEVRARGERIAEDESFLFGAEGAYLLWPFKISGRRPSLSQRWNERISSLAASGQLIEPPPIDRDVRRHSTGALLESIDIALEDNDTDYRAGFEACRLEAPGNTRGAIAPSMACALGLLDRVEMPSNAVGQLLDIRADETRHMVNTRLYPGEADELVVEIGTMPPEVRQGERVPHWPCGRLE